MTVKLRHLSTGFKPCGSRWILEILNKNEARGGGREALTCARTHGFCLRGKRGGMEEVSDRERKKTVQKQGAAMLNSVRFNVQLIHPARYISNGNEPCSYIHIYMHLTVTDTSQRCGKGASHTVARLPRRRVVRVRGFFSPPRRSEGVRIFRKLPQQAVQVVCGGGRHRRVSDRRGPRFDRARNANALEAAAVTFSTQKATRR